MRIYHGVAILFGLTLVAAEVQPVLGSRAAVVSPPPNAAARRACETLKSMRLPHLSIVAATFVEEGVIAGSSPTISGPTSIRVPAHCEVSAMARPTSDSDIGIAIWLPARGWNGKYQQIGNGGWAGAIHKRPLAEAVRRGYAAASTDDGHQGGISDDGKGDRSAAFAIGHPEKLIDFGYRALSETRAAALAAIRVFYGRDARRSYFVGCSDGGREALMVAQRFPEDFDGILAGNPGNAWSRWAAGLVWNQQAQLIDTPSAIPIGKRALVQNAVMEACDKVDGVKDGLISDPRFCRFDPIVLKCKGADANDCLTSAQIVTLQRIYDGPRNPRTGAQIFPGFPPGIENTPGSNLITPARPGAFSFGDSYFGQVLFGREDWDFRTLDFDRDIMRSDRGPARILDATSPDLRSFRAHGGKLIQYHGWSDALMPAAGSIAYYEAVRRFMAAYPDPGAKAPASIDGFYRLFMIPGMGHCYGGAGPVSIAPEDPQASPDPKRDLLAALDLWVEKNVAPEDFIGTGKTPGDPTKTMSRPICRYPNAARYRGSGDTNSAASFECVAAPSRSREAGQLESSGEMHRGERKRS